MKQVLDPRRTPTLTWVIGLALLLSAAACADDGEEAGAAAQTAAAETAGEVADEPAAGSAAEPVAAEPVGPTTDLPPNELGEVMVLEYHRLGDNEGEWVRSAEHFREDLRALYQRGYRPVTMREVARGEIDVPAGTTPVVFTFDDSSRGQFYLLEDGGIDPHTFVGMWDAFREENPAWRGGATWCVLPGAEHPSNFFGERPSKEMPREQREANIRRKVQWLVDQGHEICNHTMWHARLDRYDDAFVQDQIGSGADSIGAYLPEDYEITTFALPLGMWPKNRSLAWQGTYRDGKSYRHEAVLEVSGGPNVSPFHVDFDPHSVNRLIVAPGHLERQLAAYEQSPGRRYVSDGDPDVVTVPADRAAEVDRARLGDRELRVVDAGDG